jgi:hypothetical protein
MGLNRVDSEEYLFDSSFDSKYYKRKNEPYYSQKKTYHPEHDHQSTKKFHQLPLKQNLWYVRKLSVIDAKVNTAGISRASSAKKSF